MRYFGLSGENSECNFLDTYEMLYNASVLYHSKQDEEGGSNKITKAYGKVTNRAGT